jgi:hypothetical protein
MRDVAVFLKAAPEERNAEILAFRHELKDRQDLRVVQYSSLDELRTELADVIGGWAQDVAGCAAASHPE